MSDERPLAAASRRLREVPGFPRRPGRPRKHTESGSENGHVSGQATSDVAQHREATRENGHGESAGVRSALAPAPTVALGRSSGDVVAVAPALLSVADAGRYLGVSPRTVEGYVAAGLVVPVRLPSPRGGRHLGRVLLERAELDRLVARSRGRP